MNFVFWSGLWDFVFPLRCVVCGLRLERPSLRLIELKELGLAELAQQFFCYCCDPFWGKQFPLAGIRTLLLSEDSLEFPDDNPGARITSVLRFSPEVEYALKAYKYGGQRGLAEFFALVLLKALPQLKVESADLLIPLPSTFQSLRTRGFQHIYEICKILSRFTEIPTDPFALVNTRQRKAQASLAIKDRARFIAGSMRANSQAVSGKRILLLDDLITSGNSIYEASRALLSAGALRVDVLSISVSERFTPLRMLQDSSPLTLLIPESKSTGLSTSKRISRLQII